MTQVKLAKKADLQAAQADATQALADAATAQSQADSAYQLANQAVNTAKPASPGTFLVSGGSVAFVSSRSFRVGAATYVINGTQYTSAEQTATIGASDPTNPRFDAIVVDTTGTVSVIAGTAAATPAFPDVDPLLYLVLSYTRIDAAASAVSIATTDIYRENTEWTSAVSGGTIVATSTNNPRNGTTSVEATNAVNGDYVRFTNVSPVSLAGQRQLVCYVRPKAAWANAKSLQVAFYLSGVKVGQSVTIKDGVSGFVSSTVAYQQIVIPIQSFGVSADSLVDRIQFTVTGGGGSIGFNLDDVFLEGASTAVPQPIVTALQAQVDNLRIRTILIPIDGGGGVITPGVKADVPLDFAGKILGWTLLADQAGSIVIDLWKDTYANYPPTVADTIITTEKPTLSSASKNQSSSTLNWNTSFNAGDIIRPNVDSVATVTRAVLALKCQVA